VPAFGNEWYPREMYKAGSKAAALRVPGLHSDAGACGSRRRLVFGASSHRIENWFFYGEGRKTASDVSDPRLAGLYGPIGRPARGIKGLPFEYEYVRLS
jgi:alpha-L-fucosidase